MAEMTKTKALVVHSIRWHETSKIVTLYSREFGLIKVIARGVFRKNSPLAGRLETLNLINALISFKETRELQILTGADLLDSFTSLKTDLERLPYALAILEIIQKVIHPGHKDEVFFDFCLQMIYAVNQSEFPLLVLWYFLLKVASYLGFKPNFDACSICQTNEFKNGAFFILQKGGLVCPDCAGQAAPHLKLTDHDLQFLRTLQKYPYKKIHELKTRFGFSVDFTALLLQYLNVHLGHPLKLESLKLIP